MIPASAIHSSQIGRNEIPGNATFIDTGSRWSNPFLIGKDGTREECLERYKQMLSENLEMLADLSQLEGMTLVSFDMPRAQFLTDLINKDLGARLDWAEDYRKEKLAA